MRSLSPDSHEVSSVLNDLGESASLSGDLVAAEMNYREALRVARIAGYAEGEAYITGNLANTALQQEDWSNANQLAQEALLLSEKIGRQELIAAQCYHLAKAFLGQGKIGEARPHAQRAVAIFTQLGSPELDIAFKILEECDI